MGYTADGAIDPRYCYSFIFNITSFGKSINTKWNSTIELKSSRISNITVLSSNLFLISVASSFLRPASGVLATPAMLGSTSSLTRVPPNVSTPVTGSTANGARNVFSQELSDLDSSRIPSFGGCLWCKAVVLGVRPSHLGVRPSHLVQGPRVWLSMGRKLICFLSLSLEGD